MGFKIYRILFFTLGLLFVGGLCSASFCKSVPQTDGLIAKDFNVDAFEQVELGVPAQVEIIQSDRHSVRVEASGKVLSSLQIFVKENTLYIRLKTGKRKDVYSTGRKQITIYVSSPKLTSVVQCGVGDILLKGRWWAPYLELRLKGVGNVRAEALRCNRLEVYFTGTGSFSLSGEVKSALYKNSGIGNLQASGMKVDVLTVRHSGVGDIYCRATKWLGVKISGIGNVIYYGTPLSMDFSKGSAGKIRQGKH